MAEKTNCVKNGIKYYRITPDIGKKLGGPSWRKDFYGKNKKDAEAQRDAFIEEEKKKRLTASYSDLPIKDLMYIWLFEVRLPSDNAPATFTMYEGRYRNYIKDSEIGLLKPHEVTRMGLQRFYNRLIDAGKTAGIVKGLNKLLSVFFNYCIENEFISKNPCWRLKLPGQQEMVDVECEEDDEDDDLLPGLPPLEKSEIDLIKAGLKDDDREVLFLVALATGIRQGEELALTFRDISSDYAQVKITKTLSNTKVFNKDGTHEYKMLAKPPKTKSSRRVVTIPDGLIAPLKQHVVKQKELYTRIGTAWNEKLPIFTTVNGTYIDRRNLLRSWVRLLKRVNVPYRKWHIIRKTCATKLFEAGVPIKTVQTMLGHASIAVTEKIYIEVMPEQKQKAANELNYLFN